MRQFWGVRKGGLAGGRGIGRGVVSPIVHTIASLNKRKRVALAKRRLKKRKLKARTAASR